jgi:hypothetical protein
LENFEKLDALRGIFLPSQKLKDIPTKCTFWVNFVGKTFRSVKKSNLAAPQRDLVIRMVMKYLSFLKKC